MAVSLKQLERAVAAVEDISRYTLDFEVENTQFTLRLVRPSEELEVYAHVRESLENIIVQHDWLAAKQYVHLQRLSLLSFSIIRMGDLDLSGEYVDTGEMTDAGVPIQVPKAQALREHLEAKWTSTLMGFVFSKYGELVAKQNERNHLHVDNEKIDEHIARLRAQLVELERIRPPDIKPEDVVRSVFAQKADRRAQKEVLMPEVKIPTPDVPDPRVEPASPEDPPPPPPPPPTTPPTAEVREREPVYPKEIFDPRNPDHRGRAAFVPEPHRGDSFMDPSDPEQAVAAEHARQLHFQRIQQEIAKARAEAEAKQSQPRSARPTESVPTFKLPPEDLGGDVHVAPAMAMESPTRTQNPRFMPRR